MQNSVVMYDLQAIEDAQQHFEEVSFRDCSGSHTIAQRNARLAGLHDIACSECLEYPPDLDDVGMLKAFNQARSFEVSLNPRNEVNLIATRFRLESSAR